MARVEAAQSAWQAAVEQADRTLASELREIVEEDAFVRLLALRAAASAVIEALAGRAGELAAQLPALERAVAALAAIEDRALYEAERAARHGELAGAGHDARERQQALRIELDEARGAIDVLAGALRALAQWS